METTYEPFGEEWKKEMMKMKKSDLINMLKEVFQERNKLLQQP